MYKSFTEMPGWQKAHQLSMEVFTLTIKLPRSEDYGLTSQIRRSANSVAGNFAEAFGRSTHKDKTNFYIVARGSAFETQSHLLYGEKIGYFETEPTKHILTQYQELIHEINKIIKTLKSLSKT